MTAARPQWVLLITKNSFSGANDGGSKRVNAVVRAIESSGLEVEAVPGVTSERPRRHGAGFLRELTAFLRVLTVYLRVGSLSSLKWLRFGAVQQMMRAVADRDSAPSAVVIEFTQMLPYHVAVGGPLLVDMHNIESGLLANYAQSTTSSPRRLVARWETVRMTAMECLVAEMADAVAFVSESDQARLESVWEARGLRAPDAVVAPNGIEDEFFDFEGERDGSVVFVGHLGWQPNVDAAIWLASEVWPRVLAKSPARRLLLVGRHPAPAVQALASDSIAVHRDVPSVVEYFGKAELSVAPLLAAGGTRIKILESLGAGTPVAATSMGALGLESLSGTYLRIASDAEALSSAIDGLLTANPPDRSAVRRLVSRFGWAETLSPLVAALRRVLE